MIWMGGMCVCRGDDRMCDGRGEGRRPRDADLLVTGYTEPQAQVCPGWP